MSHFVHYRHSRVKHDIIKYLSWRKTDSWQTNFPTRNTFFTIYGKSIFNKHDKKLFLWTLFGIKFFYFDKFDNATIFLYTILYKHVLKCYLIFLRKPLKLAAKSLICAFENFRFSIFIFVRIRNVSKRMINSNLKYRRFLIGFLFFISLY